ncbi:MAG: hypothetical protein AB7K09_03305 [Planctomycetota bacterium]
MSESLHPASPDAPVSEEQIRVWIQAIADGQPVPDEVRKQIECCVHKSREVEEARSCVELMRGCLQRAMIPDEDTRTRLVTCVKAGLAAAPGTSGASNSDGDQLERARSTGSPRPLWLVWVAGLAAGILLTLVLMGGGGQDAMATDALRSLDRIEPSLVWRMPSTADESHYLKMLNCLHGCSICHFVQAIPEPRIDNIRLIGASNTLELDGRSVASLFYEAMSDTTDTTGSGSTGKPWRFIVFMLQMRPDEKLRDMLPHGRQVQRDGDDVYILCEADGRCCIAWQDDVHSTACFLTATLADVPRDMFDFASSFRHCKNQHTVEGCSSGQH